MADLKAEFCQLYFANLNYLLMHRATLILQKIFLDRWHKTTNKKWSNSEEQGKAFVSEIGKDIWTTSSRRQKILLESGNVYLWDLKLCSHVLRKFHNDNEEEKKRLKELVVIQNEIKRNFDELFIPEDLYKNSWERVKKILEDFGHTMIPYAIEIPNFAWSSKDLQVLKNSLKSPKQFFMDDTFPEDIDPLQTLKAKDLKELGNTFYKDNKYDEALRVYKQALNLKEVSKELQGILYSNASAVCSHEKFGETPLLNDYTSGFKFSDDIIEEYAKKGSVTAEKLKKATAHCRKALDYLKIHGDLYKAINELANALRISELVVDGNKCSIAVEMVSLFDIEIQLNTQFDIDFRVCKIFTLGNDYQSSISLLEESMKMYTDERWFPMILTRIYGFVQNHKKGIEVANEALKKFPDDAGIWYAKAVHLRNLELNDIRIIDAYKKFISLVPPDHRKIPISYYTIAAHYLKHNPEDLTTVTKYYKHGLDAEKIQLPFFLPVECFEKSLLENLSSLKPFLRLQFANDEPIPRKAKVEEKENEEGEELKKFLNPHRVGLIVPHRKKVADMKRKLAKLENTFQFLKATLKPKLQQTGPPQLAEVKSIVLDEMDPTKNQIYEGFALSCVVIDEPILGFPSVQVIIEDENWDVERLCVYNIPQDEEVYSKLGFGCRLTILNPYYKKGELDNTPLIRVDDPESIVFEDADVGRCRFCGKNRAILQCSKCHRAAYCNRECQTNDWKVMKHKLICH